MVPVQRVARETVGAALDAIVKHYSDPIHTVQESLSYFDAAQSPPSVPPVVQHWIDRLTCQRTRQDIDSDSTAIIFSEGTAAYLINGYSQWIRPALFCRQHVSSTITLSLTGIPVLQHYVLLLSQILQTSSRNDLGKSFDNELTENAAIMSLQQQQQQLDETTMMISELLQPLDEIASDISLLTKLATHQNMSETNGSEPSLHMIANIVLPTIIRLLTHGIDIIMMIGSSRSQRIINSNDESLRKALQKCAVVLLAFGYPRMNPRDVLPSLETNLLMMQENPFFLYVPMQHRQKEVHRTQAEGPRLLGLGYHLTEEHFWSQLQLDGSPWEDAETGVVSRAVERFWRHLLEYKSILLPKDTPGSSSIMLLSSGDSYSEPKTSDSHSGQSTSSTVKLCLHALSGENRGDTPQAVRAHFFGRDVTNLKAEDRLMSAAPATSARLHLGRTISVPEESADPIKSMNKAFVEIPSRVHAALHYILLLQRDDMLDSNRSDGNSILEEMLPVIFELLSAHEKAYIALGSAALIHLLSLLIPSTQLGGESNMNSAKRDIVTCSEAPLAKYTGSLLPVLNLACRTCREGAPLVLLTRAQSMVCQMANLSGYKLDATLVKHRRTTTSFFLTILDKHSHEVSDPDDLLWSLLVGGIIPLLYQHQTEKGAIDNVDAMEIGRLGLTALLPILRYSSGWSLDNDDDADADERSSKFSATSSSNYNSTRKLLAPSVLALVYLLQVAYPIMPRHGGKIMSELLALLGNLQRQNISTTGDLTLVNLTKDAAGVALAICGDRAAQVLELVASRENMTHGVFEPGIVGPVEDIRNCARRWSEAQRQASIRSKAVRVMPGVVLLE